MSSDESANIYINYTPENEMRKNSVIQRDVYKIRSGKFLPLLNLKYHVHEQYN